MKPIARSVQTSDWFPTFSATDLLRSLGGGLRRLMGFTGTYVEEYREARASEQLYRELSRLSDAELARRGLDKGQLAQLVKKGA